MQGTIKLERESYKHFCGSLVGQGHLKLYWFSSAESVPRAALFEPKEGRSWDPSSGWPE